MLRNARITTYISNVLLSLHIQPICAESMFEYTPIGNLMNKSVFARYRLFMHMMQTYKPLFVFFSGECPLVHCMSRGTIREWNNNKKKVMVCMLPILCFRSWLYKYDVKVLPQELYAFSFFVFLRGCIFEISSRCYFINKITFILSNCYFFNPSVIKLFLLVKCTLVVFFSYLCNAGITFKENVFETVNKHIENQFMLPIPRPDSVFFRSALERKRTYGVGLQFYFLCIYFALHLFYLKIN